MFQFEHPIFLWALLALPLLYAGYWWSMRRRKRDLATLGASSLLSDLMPHYDTRRYDLKFGLWLSALALLCIAAAHPRMGTRPESVERKGVEVLLAFDLSSSMLATDLYPNRLEMARYFAEILAEALSGNRVGLEVFADAANIQVPPTFDFEILKMYLEAIQPPYRQGTSIAAAIHVARESTKAEAPYARALVIISDGEDHEEGVEAAASEALADGMQVFTVGVGTPQGALIKVDNDKTRARDDEVEVRTRLNETMLRNIALSGGGRYVHLTPDNIEVAARELAIRIEQLEYQQVGVETYETYNSYYAPFLGLAMLLIVLEFLLPDARKSARIWQDLWRG